MQQEILKAMPHGGDKLARSRRVSGAMRTANSPLTARSNRATGSSPNRVGSGQDWMEVEAVKVEARS